jgi:hypothetical protein
MWNSPKHKIPESHVKQEHLNALWRAVQDAGEFDPHTPEVYAALDYLQKRSNRTWGFTVFREALQSQLVVPLGEPSHSALSGRITARESVHCF